MPSSFVGRSGDLEAVADRFRRGVRLVTVTGPGGIGKTRLALRLAEAEAPAYGAHRGGGAWFCDVTEARSAAEIAAIVASALHVELRSAASEVAVVEQVGRALSRRGRTLLVLDNFEHLVREAGATVGLWSTHAPATSILVTSRCALDLPGEELWSLPALPRDEALALFVGRARQLRPGFAAAEEALGVVTEIVDRLEGMPLAIELAASRLAVLSPAELRDRLTRPLDVLARPGGDTRHASMRRAIVDSVQGLDDAARRALAESSVFRGSFTLEAAEAVLTGQAVIEHVETLARHSLLRAAPTDDAGGALRFSFFETIRAVAVELLVGQPSAPEVALRHAAYYTGLARTLGTEAATRSGGVAYAKLGREVDNLLAAHARAIEADDPRQALDLALGLEPLLSARGQTRLRLRLLDEAITLAERRPSSVNANALAEGLLARGLARRELGELDVARADLDAGLSRANASSSPALAALAELRIGEIVEVGGSTGNARARFATALELLASAPENETRTLREAEAHQRIGHALRREGALDEAASAIEAAATRYRKLGHDEGLAWALYEAAVVAMFRGRMDEALARFDEGLSVARRSGARTVGAVLTTGRGGLLQDLGKAEEALVHHADAAQVFRELGTRYREMSAVYYLATAYLDTGDAHEATRFLTFALELSRDVAVPRYEALIEGGRAVALAALGDRNSAEQALANAERARASCGSEHALRATIAIHGLTLAVQASAGDAARAVTEAEALASANPSDDSHFALRMLLVASGRRAQPTPNALVLFEDRRCVRLPRAKETTDLSGREPLWSIVRLLARRRNETPGEAVPVDDILAAAWPGERIGAEAAMNRIYVALATLRRLGLRPYLVTGSGGYLFSPAISVTVLP